MKSTNMMMTFCTLLMMLQLVYSESRGEYDSEKGVFIFYLYSVL